MNRDDIVNIALKALEHNVDYKVWTLSTPHLERFASLIAEAEREACCQIVYGYCGSDNVAARTVEAIKARGT